MVYFLINNNYHLYDLKLLIEHSQFDCALIQIPHTLNVVKTDIRFSRVYEFEYFYTGFLSLFNLKVINKVHQGINSELLLDADDVLFVYSDYEILNQYIIAKFKKVGCKVFILEDGLATALVYNLKKKPLPLKQKLKLFIIKNLVGYQFTDLLFENENYYPVINDNYIDGICFYLETKIKRNIPITYITNNTIRIENLRDDVAIFLNQDTYLFDQSEQSYFQDLTQIFDAICTNFTTIFFKFHPRETNEKKVEIKFKLQNYSNIEYIESTTAVEELIRTVNPRYAISYYSSSLKNLFFLGVEPVFIYHLLPSIASNDFSLILNQYLENLNYNFPQSFDQISPTYSSNLSINRSTLPIEKLFQ